MQLDVDFVQIDVRNLRWRGPVVDTVVMNPPFGTRKKEADMDFLFETLKKRSRRPPLKSSKLEKKVSILVKLNPSLADAWLCLGNCIWKKGDLPSAKNCFTLALSEGLNKKILCQLSMLERRMAQCKDLSLVLIIRQRLSRKASNMQRKLVGCERWEFLQSSFCHQPHMVAAIAITNYHGGSEMDNVRATDETESSEARMARLERTVKMLTEALKATTTEPTSPTSSERPEQFTEPKARIQGQQPVPVKEAVLYRPASNVVWQGGPHGQRLPFHSSGQ
ncbi:hypothetical protein HYC85_018517 [Camellia sinensis]|uniref:Methyltransferase small domain-containing protein n=1 Tax=Camellia sinensis TaxID=4442 RepID=A0A7J7GUU4_CAMSI|nr:hypothetical protein HYC85_018517 [Camellia sinensis]